MRVTNLDWFTKREDYRDTTGGSVLMLRLEQVCLRNVLLQLISRELLQTFFSFALRMMNKVFG